MQRRKLLIGLGALSAGGAAAAGTGAFTSVEADRDVMVDVAGDASAFLSLSAATDESGDELPNGEYATENEDGTLELDFTETEEGGDGLNPESVTVARNVFEVENQGTQAIEVDFEGPEGDPVVFPEEDVIMFLLPEDAPLPFPLELNSGESQKMSVIAAVSDGIVGNGNLNVDDEYTITAEAI